MEDNNQTKAKSIFSSRWFQIILMIFGLILLISGIYKIFQASSSKVSNEFIGKFNEIQQSSGQLNNELASVSNILVDIQVKEQSKDYAGAAKDLGVGLEKLDNMVSQVNMLNPQIAEFKIKVNESKDPAVKQSGLKFTDLLEQRSVLLLKVVGELKQLIEPSKKYYEGLAENKKVSFLTESEITAINQKLNADSQALEALGNQWNTVIQELAKAAGFELKPLK